ncbi:MAG: hypothetical protein K2X39_09320 [Silvanigrellaceae bacterium]|nr:hypothetical protein [Silvanigrellaceae bacterium]
MVFFGKYLVEKKVISESDFLKIIIEQIRNTPSVAEIIYDLKILSLDDQCRVIDLQIMKDIEYLSACKQLGLWNTELEVKTFAEIKKRKISFAQLLLREKMLTYDQIVKYLDEFIENLIEKKTYTKIEPSIQNVDTIAKPFLEDDGIIWTDEVFIPNNNEKILNKDRKLNTNLIYDFLDLFTAHNYVELRKLAESQTDSEEDIENLNKISNQLRTIHSGLVFIQAIYADEIVILTIKYIENIIKQKPKKELFTSLMNNIKKSLEIIWKLRNSIIEHQTDEHIMNELSFKNEVLNLKNNLLSFISN